MKPHKIQPSPHPLLDSSNVSRLQNQLSQVNIQQKNYKDNQVELSILQYLQVKFQINQIPINEEEFLHTIFIETTQQSQKNKYFYLTHGFGGSSLMYFPIVKYLLEHGNIILWEIRGMGFSRKLNKYQVSLQQSQRFFLQPIQIMLEYYSHPQIFFISHSFGGYLTLLYILKYKKFLPNVKQVILLSPVGITPKQQDYKYRVKSFSDAIHSIGNNISWKFHLTYKSPFRCICACLKQKVFKGAVDDCQFTQEEKFLMKSLLIGMVELSDGSQNVFFNYFQPRVLPKFAILPIFKECPKTKIKIIYGGQEDWVDKTGAQKVRDKYPSHITLKKVKQCGHNFPFFPLQLKKILDQILFNHKHSKNQSLLTQVQSQYLKPNISTNLEQKQNTKTPRFDEINQNSDQTLNKNQKEIINDNKKIL